MTNEELVIPGTPYEYRVSILAELWMGYRHDEDFEDFCDYNDLGLPLAYCIDNDIIKSTPSAATFINETWELLLAAFEIDVDSGFENLDELLSEYGD